MKSIDNFVRNCFDVCVPVLGDVDMYLSRVNQGLGRREALVDMSTTLCIKYMAYGIFVYRVLNDI